VKKDTRNSSSIIRPSRKASKWKSNERFDWHSRKFRLGLLPENTRILRIKITDLESGVGFQSIILNSIRKYQELLETYRACTKCVRAMKLSRATKIEQ
jgi:hypothetical protein